MSEPVEAIACSNCGAMLRPGMLRCRECGTAVGAVPSAPTTSGSATPSTPALPVESASGDVPRETPTVTSPRPLWNLAFPARRIATATAVAVVALAVVAGVWFLSTRQRLPREVSRVLTARGERLTCVAASRDGHYVFAGCASGNVIVWELPSGILRTLTKQSSEPILSLAISTDGFLVAGGVEPKLFGWENATEATKTKERAQGGFPTSVVCVGLRPNASEMAAGLADGSLMFFGNRDPLRITSAHPNGVRTLAYAPDGKTLVTGGVEGTLVWRSAETGDPLGPPAQYTADLGGVAVSPDGGLTVAGDWNGQLRWFETSTRKPTKEIDLPDAVSAVAVTDNLVVAAGWDGRLRCWTRAGGTVVLDAGTGGAIAGLALFPNGLQAATVANDERLLLWDLPK